MENEDKPSGKVGRPAGLTNRQREFAMCLIIAAKDLHKIAPWRSNSRDTGPDSVAPNAAAIPAA